MAEPPVDRGRRREWNRSPLLDLFPRIPDAVLETILDFAVDRKNFVYNLSESKLWNARHLNHMVIAHVRHRCTAYDALLRTGIGIGDDEGEGGDGSSDGQPLERYAARQRTAPTVWKILKTWSPWNDSNPALERCFQVTLLPPEQRDPTWDPMDVDLEDESDFAPDADAEGGDDPMDLD